MHKGGLLISFLIVSVLLIGGTLGALTLHSSSPQVDAAQLYAGNTTKKIIPTPAHSIAPTPTSKPTATPTPIPIKIPTPTSKPVVIADSAVSSSISDYLLGRINGYRKSNGLYAVVSNSETCAFAATRAQEISTGFSHDGFTNRINSHTLPYPSYHKITENIAMNSDYTNVVTAWINSPGHAENMRADTPFVCVGKFGNYYAYEGWKP